jgi:hypothetical protein
MMGLGAMRLIMVRVGWSVLLENSFVLRGELLGASKLREDGEKPECTSKEN